MLSGDEQTSKATSDEGSALGLCRGLSSFPSAGLFRNHFQALRGG
jgi:hypothetical protein